MSTKFNSGGNKTGFNPSGKNEVTPNLMGPPTTKFGGRGALPMGPLKRYPGGAADIEGGNRTLAKAKVGSGEESGVTFNNSFGFGKR